MTSRHDLVRGVDLLDVTYLRRQVLATAGFWGSDHRADLTAAWWYGASQVLLDPVVVAAVSTALGRPRRATADPRGLLLHRSGLFFTEAVPTQAAVDVLTDSGPTARTGGAAAVPTEAADAVSTEAAAAAPAGAGTDAPTGTAPLDDRVGVDLLVGALSRVSGSAPAVFRALGGDTLGSRLLFNAPGAPLTVLTALAADLAARTGLPVPRLVDTGRGPVLVRTSCCRLFRLPRGALCTACPRRLALERVHD